MESSGKSSNAIKIEEDHIVVLVYTCREDAKETRFWQLATQLNHVEG